MKLQSGSRDWGRIRGHEVSLLGANIHENGGHWGGQRRPMYDLRSTSSCPNSFFSPQSRFGAVHAFICYKPLGFNEIKWHHSSRGSHHTFPGGTQMRKTM